MIYVPDSTTFNKCFVLQSEDVIRAYDVTPRNNTSYNYRDYYIHSDYYYRDGSGTWSNYSTLPICIDPNSITHNYVYRVDFYQICIISAIIIGVFWFLVSKLVKTLLYGRKLF